MNSIKTIIRLELTELCFSPITWLVMVVFAVQNNYSYVDLITDIVSSQELHGGAHGITTAIFSSTSGLFANIQQSLFWYVPLLTMGIFSKEKNGGTDKLLFSSPISVWDIVIGKYLSLQILGVALLLCFAPIVIQSAWLIEHFDYGKVLSGLLGLYCLYAIYSAIGMFMSSLTGYTILAGIGTFSILMFLNMVGQLGQYSPVLRDITYWFSMRGRASSMIDGLIASDDLCYFLILVMLFIGFAILRVRYKQHSVRWVRAGAGYLFLVVCTVLLAFITSRPSCSFSWDVTADRSNTLSSASLDILKRLEGPIRITTFVNMADNYHWMGVPSAVNNDKKLFRSYYRAKSDIEMDYVYYEADPLMNPSFQDPDRLPTQETSRLFCEVNHMDQSKLLKGAQLDRFASRINLRDEGNTFVRLIEYPTKNRSSLLRKFNDMQINPSEAEISVALKGLVTSFPRIAYITDGSARPLKEGIEQSYYTVFKQKDLRQSVINQGFDLHEVDLHHVSVKELLQHYRIMILPDLSTPLDSVSCRKVEACVDAGMNLLAFSELDHSNAQHFLLDKLKLHFLPGELLYPQKAIAPDVIPSTVTSLFAELSPFIMPGSSIIMPSCGALEYDMTTPYEVYPILQTMRDKCVLWKSEQSGVEQHSGIRTLADALTKQHLYNTALALSRRAKGHEQRIIVTADADMISNKTLNTNYEGFMPQNSDFLLASLYWLSNGQSPLVINPLPKKDNSIDLRLRNMERFKLLTIYPLPLCLLLLGTILIVKRNRR